MKSLQLKLNLGLMIILFGMMSLFSTKTSATCQASFTWMQTSQNVINFTNTSTGTTINTFYNWDFGDGGYGYSQNPVYTYLVPGTYVVCLNIWDSLNSCGSTFCDSVTVTGVVICNLSVTTYTLNASCGTCTDGNATAGPNGGTSPYSYVWSPTGGTTQSISNLGIGNYTVTVTDANNCTATAICTIDTCSLHASFTWSQPSNNVIDFTDASTGTSFFTMYQWNFGDGNYGYSTNPSHTYSSPGTYYPCLTIQDSANMISCTNTYCTTITVTGVNCNNLAISSTITNTTCNTCNDGAISTTTTGGTTPYTYNWTPNVSTGSSASNLYGGNYQICVTDGIGCTACTHAWVDSSNNNTNCSANFLLYPDSLTAHLYWAVNNASGVQPLSYLWNWGDSSIVQDTMPYPSHQYAQAGIYTICLTITDAVGCSSTYCSTDSLARTANTMITVNVRIPFQTGIKKNESLNNWAVYPNPVSNSMTINYNLSTSTDVLINVYDMLGNKVAEITHSNQVAGQHSVLWNATNVPQGIYLLQFIGDNKILNQKITVMK